MSIINLYRKDNQPFAQIPNDAIRDPRITPNAFRLLAYLMSHRDGYRLNYEQIEAQTTLGRYAINESAKLLERLGWVKVDRPKLANGQFGAKSWTILSPTSVGHSTMESPHMEQPTHHIRTPSLKEEQVIKNHAQNKFELESFDLFWEWYPRKVGKKAAMKAFKKVAIQSAEILVGVQRFAHDPNLPDKQFIPHPATWLNEGRWEDEALPERVKSREELAIEQVQRSQRILDVDRQATQELLAEIRAAKSSPPPKCEHGESITRCVDCLRLERG